MRRTARALLTSALAVFAADAAHAQRYLVRTYGEFDSVANSWISDIAQTADGRMWFLTRSELLIYDGTEWERIDVPLEHLGLARIRVDSRDRPCILEGSGGLATPGAAGSAQPRWKIVPSFRSLSPEADFDVTVLEGPGGPQPVLAAVRGGLWRFDGEQWRAASEAFGFAERRIYAVEHLGRRMVLGTDEGLIEIDGSSVDRGLQQRLGLPAGAVLGLAAESSDADSGHEGLWVVGDGWIARAGSAAQVPEVLTWNTGLLPTGRVARVAADRQGGLFLGDEDALLYASLDDRAVRRFGVEQGLPCEGSTALLLDREGSLWIGSRMGLSR